MRRTLKKVLKDCATGIDGETYDVVRVLVILACVELLILQAKYLFITHEFSAQDFGVGFGAILAAGGAALGFKERTEPRPANTERVQDNEAPDNKEISGPS